MPDRRRPVSPPPGGPGQQILHRAHQRAADDDEERRADDMEQKRPASDRPAARTRSAAATIAGVSRAQGNQLASSPTTSWWIGIRRSLREHQRKLPGEHEPDRGPEREAGQRTGGQPDEVAEPGRADLGGGLSRMGLAGSSCMKETPERRGAAPGRQRTVNVSGAGRRPAVAEVGHEPPLGRSSCFRHTVRYLV